MQGKLIDNHQLAIGFVPVNMAAAANPGDYVSLKNYNHVAVVFVKAAGAAGEDPVLTIQQAQDVAGTGAKALNFTEINVKQGADLQAIGTFTKVTQAAANTYTEATSGEAQAIWVVEFDAEDLDVDGGFDCITASVADVGVTAQNGTVLFILSEPRYSGPLTSAIAN